MFTVDFEPVGRRGRCPADQSLLDCARHLNVDLVNICGGNGICKHCRVQIITGEVSEITSEDRSSFAERELDRNYRLACRCYPRGDVKVHIPPESLTAPQRTQVEGQSLTVACDPLVRGMEVRMAAPTLAAAESDDQNLRNALVREHGVAAGHIDLEVQQGLSPALRAAGWHVRVGMRGDEIVWVGPPSARWTGLAVDIGTTKIAAYLVDLATGQTIAAQGLMNPQISHGEDIISRIAAARKSPEDARKMQSLLVDALNAAIASMCADHRCELSNIVDAVLVGNTAIHHLFLRLPVRQLGVSPYVPAVRAAVDVKARDLGLHIAPGAYVHMPANVAGFVGADHVAMLLASGIADAGHTVLAIDIGTNTELCLKHRGGMSSVSCASGPAFEGAHIRFGMRAAPGAIEHVRLSGEKLDIQTIGGESPVGICGSGLLDVVAQLRLNGVLDSTGRMHPHPRVRRRDGLMEFVLAEREGREPITVSQKDVRELQMAKAAIRAGIDALIEAEGLTEGAVDEVILAGAFGTYLDVESAIEINMLPALPPERYKQVGNAAGTGARLALVSRAQRALAREIALRDRYIELGCIPGFNRKFAAASSMARSNAPAR